MMSNSPIAIQRIFKSKTLPSTANLKKWVAHVLAQEKVQGSIVIRIVDLVESQQLNQTYRGKNKPTNVLSFPFAQAETFTLPEKILGDLVLCAPLIKQEANEQNKSVSAHWAHLIIHGTLHLLGYDHMIDEEAETMEALEIKLLAQLGYPNPYE